MPGVQASNPFGVAFGASSIQGLIEKKDRKTDALSSENNRGGVSLNGNSRGASLTVDA